MATLDGFEPPTPGSEDRCSIQLSYRAMPYYTTITKRLLRFRNHLLASSSTNHRSLSDAQHHS